MSHTEKRKQALKSKLGDPLANTFVGHVRSRGITDLAQFDITLYQRPVSLYFTLPFSNLSDYLGDGDAKARVSDSLGIRDDLVPQVSPCLPAILKVFGTDLTYRPP